MNGKVCLIIKGLIYRVVETAQIQTKTTSLGVGQTWAKLPELT